MFGVGFLLVKRVALMGAIVFGLGAAPAVAEHELIIIKADGTELALDHADLDAMPRVSFSTSTLWTDGVKEFSGVPLKHLLAEAGITEGEVQAIALNDYAVTIPVQSLEDDAPIVADRIDGNTFGRRDKGPLWIVYPYDAATKYRSEEAYGRSVWQLVRLAAQ